MTNEAENPLEKAAYSTRLSVENYTIIEELAHLQGQEIREYIAFSLRAGFFAANHYLTNQTYGIETFFVTADVLPLDPDDTIEGRLLLQIDFERERDKTAQEYSASPDEADENEALWAFLESDLSTPGEDMVVDLPVRDAERLTLFVQALGWTEEAFINWCLGFRRVLDSEKASGRHLVYMTSDGYSEWDHFWSEGEFDECDGSDE